MNKKQRKEKLAKRQSGEKEAIKRATEKEEELKNKEMLKYIVEQDKSSEIKKELTFVEKLEIWTKGFTEPMLDIAVVLSDNRSAPKFSGIEESAMYEKVKKQFDECMIISRNNASKAWELFRKRYINHTKNIPDVDGER